MQASRELFIQKYFSVATTLLDYPVSCGFFANNTFVFKMKDKIIKKVFVCRTQDLASVSQGTAKVSFLILN